MIASMFFSVLLGAAPELPPESLLRLPGSFEDQQGRRLQLPELAGAPTILAMFYATCPRACPQLIGSVKSLLGELSEEERAVIRVVLVSLDPEHDSPQVLAATASARGLSAKTFTLLRSDPVSTRTLATALGVRYRKSEGPSPDGAIEHLSKIVLLGRDGVMLASKDGAADAAPLLSALRELLHSKGP